MLNQRELHVLRTHNYEFREFVGLVYFFFLKSI
jgi:hypothetical protein